RVAQNERKCMNHRFDELTKSLSQSVTRRGALKRFGVGLAGFALARLGLNQAQAITGGVLDGNTHPNVGGMVWLVSPHPDAQGPLVCGSGALIHPRVYVTAGHAIEVVQSMLAQGIMTLDDLRVSFDSNIFDSDSSNPTAWRPVSGVLTHPGYVPNA